ncbi:MAG: hypothetical protein ACTTJF_08600 [Campylobacter sp.]|uniref:hypothetical protein n=1 Tax=Campylobacter sp. TaxID=205 RepID=UPI003F9FAD17
MRISELQQQKISLGKAYVKSYSELFSKYLEKTQDSGASKKDKENAYNELLLGDKAMRKAYETAKYKLDIKESPSIHTMYSAVNYKQSMLLDEMQEKLKVEQANLQEKLKSGKYNYFEKADLKAEYDELEKKLKKEVFDKVDKFKIDYYDALIKGNASKIDKMEDSLLSNLLSQV